MDLRFFANKQVPAVKVFPSKLLAVAGMVVSQSEGRRLVVGGIVKLNDQPISDLTVAIEVKNGDVLTVGHNKRVEITQDLLERLQ